MGNFSGVWTALTNAWSSPKLQNAAKLYKIFMSLISWLLSTPAPGHISKLSTGDLLRVDTVSLKEKQSCCLGLSLTELGLQQNRNRWNSDSTKKTELLPKPILQTRNRWNSDSTKKHRGNPRPPLTSQAYPAGGPVQFHTKDNSQN